MPRSYEWSLSFRYPPAKTLNALVSPPSFLHEIISNAEVQVTHLFYALFCYLPFPCTSIFLSTSILTLTLLMSYIYGVPILDVSRPHTTTHHSR